MDTDPHVRALPSPTTHPKLRRHCPEQYESLLTSFLSSNIMTNEQKKDWFLRLDPNGRIPVIVDHTQSPPFPVMETSAELLYLLKFADKNDVFGFKDELERSQALQWLFFWHGRHLSELLCPPSYPIRSREAGFGSWRYFPAPETCHWTPESSCKENADSEIV